MFYLKQAKVADDNIRNTVAFKMGNGIIWTTVVES